MAGDRAGLGSWDGGGGGARRRQGLQRDAAAAGVRWRARSGWQHLQQQHPPYPPHGMAPPLPYHHHQPYYPQPQPHHAPWFGILV